MKLTLIAAMDLETRGIGSGNELLYRIPEDMLRFRDLTIGNPIIMGRKTFDSIGRPLPKRENLVISRTMEEREGVKVFRSIVDAFHYLVDEKPLCHAYVIGGEEIYKLALPWADEIQLTEISMWSGSERKADAFFPPIPDSFVEVSRERNPGGRPPLGVRRFDFVHYKRMRKF